MVSVPARLEADLLAWHCEGGNLGFGTTDELADLDGVIGQERAIEALSFALGMRRADYNVYALGPDGIGKHTIVDRLLERQAAEDPQPFDWCYVNNFAELRKPRALQLGAGRGGALRDDVARLIDDLGDALRSAFDNPEYRSHRQLIEEELKERHEQAIGEVEEAAKAKGIALMRSQMGFAFAPMVDGKVMDGEAFQNLAAEDRKRIEGDIQELQKHLRDVLLQAPAWMKEGRERVRRLNETTALFAIGHLFEAVRERYADLPEVLAHLEEMRRDVAERVEAFLADPEAGPQQSRGGQDDGLKRRYAVNLMVGNTSFAHAPVVYEDDPTYDRLFGRIEQRAEMGTLVTDLGMIRPGALHRANRGYLVLDARKLLMRPMAFEGLKRALHSREIRIESVGQAMGLINTVSLEPEPIPLEVKVVLIGERLLYYLLMQADPEFGRLFKVAADFDERIARDEESCRLYARLVATLIRRERLRPFTCGGVARLLEHAAREAGDSAKLATTIEDLLDVVREADYEADRAGRATAGAPEVQRALDAADRRHARLRERAQEAIAEGLIHIATDGSAIGQVNGLSVSQIGGFAFGRPARISARVRLGRGEVVDIEREVALGGPLHAKGVLILQGYLAAHYAPEHPLSLAATLVFEQSYGGVDGDSASSTELYALISAIARIPLRQDLAITGSVDQHGRVQAIGGVNEKIEGFFDVCAARGLTGAQGVLIPASNVRHLMLHRRVRDAVAEGRFHIHPVATIDEGLALLTGREPGVRGADGRFPEGSVNAAVEARLLTLAERRRAFMQSARQEEERP